MRSTQLFSAVEEYIRFVVMSIGGRQQSKSTYMHIDVKLERELNVSFTG